MRKIIRLFVRWLLKIAELDTFLIEPTKKQCGLIKQGKFLSLVSANGDPIPMQRDLKIQNNLEDRGVCIVTISVLIKLNNSEYNELIIKK